MFGRRPWSPNQGWHHRIGWHSAYQILDDLPEVGADGVDTWITAGYDDKDRERDKDNSGERAKRGRWL